MYKDRTDLLPLALATAYIKKYFKRRLRSTKGIIYWTDLTEIHEDADSDVRLMG